MSEQGHVSISIRDYVDREVARAIEHQREITDLCLESLETARKTAKLEQDRRLEAMNEFREQLTLQATTFVSRELLDKDLDAIRSTLRELGRAYERGLGSSETRNWLLPNLPAVVALFASVVAIYLAIR